MNRFMDSIGVVLLLVGLFLVLFYWQGTKAVISAGSSALVGTINALQGKDSLGRLPAKYPA